MVTNDKQTKDAACVYSPTEQDKHNNEVQLYSIRTIVIEGISHRIRNTCVFASSQWYNNTIRSKNKQHQDNLIVCNLTVYGSEKDQAQYDQDL